MFGRCSNAALKKRGFTVAHGQVRHFSRQSDNKWRGWNLVIGLEVHAQLKTRAKLFSHAWTSQYGVTPNSHTDVFDASFPGTLPVKLNSSCLDLALRTAIALNSNIERHSSFDRKHYFYSDLPAGYQITQHYAPFAKGGSVNLDRSGIRVNIKQIQLEQDTAKSNFDAGNHNLAIDLNRAGSALVEIVSEPDMSTPEQAGEFVRTLRSLLRAVGSSDGNMEQGSLRCDANVSVNKPGEPHGTRCEIKNLNSIKFIVIAITSEALRHISILETGDAVIRETRGFDEDTAETYSLRGKEDALDYRYMPDPNLPPLILDENRIDSVKQSMPELPSATRIRLLSRGLSARDVDFLMSIDEGREVGFDGQVEKGFIFYFEEIVRDCFPKIAYNWVTHDLYGFLVSRNETFKDNMVSVDQMRELINLVESGRLTRPSGKKLLKYMIETKSVEDPGKLAQELSLFAFGMNGEVASKLIEDLCNDAIKEFPAEAHIIQQGNDRVINKLVGYVMKNSKGRADARLVHARFKQILLEERN